MNIHQSGAIRGCFKSILPDEQGIYQDFNNLVEFMKHRRMHANNARNQRQQTIQTTAANASCTTISRHVKLIESCNCNIQHINDPRFSPVTNKFNALIVLLKPPPRQQQVNMLPAMHSCCSEHIESVDPDVVFSAVPVAPDIASPGPKEECFDYNSWTSEIWWNILAGFCACANFDMLRIS